MGRARLEGPGATVYDMASNARGTISLVVPQGQMRAAFAELPGINVGAGLLKLMSGGQSTAAIRCAVADFDVSGGTARVRTFVIDADVVVALLPFVDPGLAKDANYGALIAGSR